MIICRKCKALNEPQQTDCRECSANLLPGESVVDRIGTLIGGIVAAALGFGLAYVTMQAPADLPECLPSSPLAWFVVGVVSLLSALAATFRKTPLLARYEARARRHAESQPEQAIADYGKALEHAPDKKRAALLQERAKLYQKLGREDDAARDRLEYTYQEGAYSTGAGLTSFIGGDAESYTASAAKSERQQLVTSGKVVALGFCPQCGDVVSLTPKLRCQVHPKTKGQAVKHVMSQDVDSSIGEVLKEYETTSKKSRRTRLACGVIIGIAAVVCVLSAVFAKLFPSETDATGTPPAGAPTMPATRRAPTPTPELNNPFGDGQVACMGAAPYGIVCLGDSGWNTFFEDVMQSWDLARMAVCPDGSIASTSYRGVTLFNGLNWIDQPSADFDYVQRLACDGQSQIWALHDQGISRFDGSEWTTFPLSLLGLEEKAYSIRELAFDHQGRLWVVAESILASFDGEEWQVLTKGEDLALEYSMSKMAAAPDGRIWVSDAFGLLMYDGDAWTQIEVPGSLLIEVMTADLDGRLWVGTFSKGLRVLEDGQWTTYNMANSPLSSDSIETLVIDARGRVWIGTSWGLNVLEGDRWMAYHMHTSPLLDNIVETILVLGEGPELPELEQKALGSIRGSVTQDGQPWANMRVAICVEVMGSLYTGDTPCSGQPFIQIATTDANGEFSMQEIPTGWYYFIFELSDTRWKEWSPPTGSRGRFMVEPGAEFWAEVD